MSTKRFIFILIFNKFVILEAMFVNDAVLVIYKISLENLLSKNQGNCYTHFMYIYFFNIKNFKVPDVILKRETECAAIKKFIKDGIKTNTNMNSRVLCISGVPGTGKTASVLWVVESLKKSLKFSFKNINGLELSDPKELFVQLYRVVMAGITGGRKKITHREAQQYLNDYFTNNESKSRKKAVVILIDEVDMLQTKREDVIYSLFNWAAEKNSRFCVIAISNTLDLAERKFSQRIGSNRLAFQPYEFKDIEEILKHRLGECKSIGPGTIELASKKVASISGDLRKAFDLVRRAIDLALEECERLNKSKCEAELLTCHIIEAIKESVTSIRMQFFYSLSKHEYLIFKALVNELVATALDDTDFSLVFMRYKKLCTSEGLIPLSLEAAFYHVQELASFQFVVLSSKNIKLHCKIKLGFPVSEAEFCLRQMDSLTKKII
ncbi:Origin recognition complex subunit 1 [Meloidogyne graminicola]|uniref:Origin recognition complex subunit 1 n=1 Tax=Meloidogyne graminicola TaxID=189291 RepID=A0A8S9ZQV4_9BILA|nr:Origin recognition complex subunit 1 [Meloidogyne graminicola]